MERVLVMSKWKNARGGGGGAVAGDLTKGGLLQFPNGKYTFERLENELRGNPVRIENCYCRDDKLRCVQHLLSYVNKDTPRKLLVLSWLYVKSHATLTTKEQSSWRYPYPCNLWSYLAMFS